MEKSGFFNSVSGDRKYDAEFFADYFSSFIANGVFPNPSSNLQVFANDDMTITISQGEAWINGYYYINDNDLVMSIDNADGVLKRIDRIVLQYSTLDREIKAVVKKGSFESEPVAPEITRDADFYELAIAEVFVNNGATEITQSNITDLRLDTDLCGIVHGVVEQVDTSTLMNQYTDGFEQKQEELEQEFNEWYSSIQEALDGDTAGNLLNSINENEEKIDEITPRLTTYTISSTDWTFNSDNEKYEATITDETVSNDVFIDLVIKEVDQLEKAITGEDFEGYYILRTEEEINIDLNVTAIKQKVVLDNAN